MKTVIFRCSENRNQHEEEIEYEDDITEEEIQSDYETWVWQEVGDNYYWFIKE